MNNNSILPITNPDVVQRGHRLLPKNFEQRLSQAGCNHVYYSFKANGETHERVNLVALERMNLYYLQKQLVDTIVPLRKRPLEYIDRPRSEKIKNLLHDYCEALRDREYMTMRAQQDIKKNPFVLKSKRPMDAALMDAIKRHGCSPYASESNDGYGSDYDLPGGPWDPITAARSAAEAARAATARYSMALMGSIILIGPMLLMVLVKGLVVRLVTVACCTAIFAFGIAKMSTRSRFELMSATAAYTAVLVVFVGTAPPN